MYLCTMDINIFSSDSSGRRPALIRHLSTLAVAVAINLSFWFFQSLGEADAGDPSGIASMLTELLSTCLEMVILMEASFAISRLVIRLFWNVKYSFLSLIMQNVMLLISVVVMSACISAVYALLFPDAVWLSWDVFLCDCLVAYFLTSVFFTSFLTNRYMNEKACAQQVTIDKLKLKTDNHFVFNSLATLGNLIQTDTDAAYEFNASMSRMYRYIVSKGDTPVVNLSEELSFMEEYRKNLSMRYEHIEISVAPELRTLRVMIPPLSLQSLVENAIKHNCYGADHNLVISISSDPMNSHIVVSNNRQPLPRRMESPGSGLKTLNDRYMAICGKGIAFDANDSRFTVSLPYIKETDLS